MDTTELTMGEKRVVEAELKLPKLSNIELPKVDWAPVRKLAADVLLTSLGIGVLAVRGAMAAAKAAYNAGADAAKKEGSVAQRVVNVVLGENTEPSQGGIKLHVPVLPIADYDALNYHEVQSKLEGLNAEQLAVLRDYETAHANRSTVLNAIKARLA